jgi:hypothetical protein
MILDTSEGAIGGRNCGIVKEFGPPASHDTFGGQLFELTVCIFLAISLEASDLAWHGMAWHGMAWHGFQGFEDLQPSTSVVQLMQVCVCCIACNP